MNAYYLVRDFFEYGVPHSEILLRTAWAKWSDEQFALVEYFTVLFYGKSFTD